MAIELLGHKRALLDFLLEPMDVAAPKPTRVADLFAGTGAVSAAFKARGHDVFANDILALGATLTGAVLLNDGPPPFAGLARATGVGPGYAAVLEHLSALPPRDGFVTETYAPRSAIRGGVERRYFTVANAQRVDAIRAALRAWEPHLSRAEHLLLLADLVHAAAAVSNVAATYGCWLSAWKPRSLAPLRLEPASFVPGSGRHTVSRLDAATAARAVEVDLVYADPPYTKRQYSAYYHVPETIIRDDAPVVSGRTGLRPWREEASRWCHRRHAPDALAELVDAARCRWFFLSYNADGQIPHDTVMAILGRRGPVRWWEQVCRRYKSTAGPHRGPNVVERLYRLDMRGAA